MSRSEERQRLRASDFAQLRARPPNKSKCNDEQSRSRSRSRSRENRISRKSSKISKTSPSTSNHTSPSRSHSRSKPRSHSRSHSRWGSRSRSKSPLKQTKTQTQTDSNANTNTQSARIPSIKTNAESQAPPPNNIQYNIDEVTLRKFCQPYTMPELVEMLSGTAFVNRDFYSILLKEMKHSSKWCKLFIHGLPWTTSQETLFSVFKKFGKINECVILKDRNGQSKGYGFINYSNAQEAINAINAGPQYIDGRMVGSDLAWKGRKMRSKGGNNNHKSNTNHITNNNGATNQNHGGMQHTSHITQHNPAVRILQNNHNNNNNNNCNTNGANNNNTLQARILIGNNGNTIGGGGMIGGALAQRRLFVYSLLYSTTDETLHRVFSQYGELEEAVIIKDKSNEMKSKGYGFVIFKNVRDAQLALKEPHKMIDGRTVHCSLAIHGKHGGMNNGNNGNANANMKFQKNLIGGGGGGAHHNHSHALGIGVVGSDLNAVHAMGVNGVYDPNMSAALAAVNGGGIGSGGGLYHAQSLNIQHPSLNVQFGGGNMAAMNANMAMNPNIVNAAALGVNVNPTHQLLQQLLVQHLQQSQVNDGMHNNPNLAPAPINPNYQ